MCSCCLSFISCGVCSSGYNVTKTSTLRDKTLQHNSMNCRTTKPRNRLCILTSMSGSSQLKITLPLQKISTSLTAGRLKEDKRASGRTCPHHRQKRQLPQRIQCTSGSATSVTHPRLPGSLPTAAATNRCPLMNCCHCSTCCARAPCATPGATLSA